MRPKPFTAAVAFVLLLLLAYWVKAQPTSFPPASSTTLAVSTNNVLQPESTNFFNRNIGLLTNELAASGFSGGSGGGTGAVESVNGQAGIVVLDATDIASGLTPTNSTPGDDSIWGAFAGVDVALGLRALTSHGHAGEDITSGTVADARIDAAIARDTEVTAAVSALSSVYQPLDPDLADLADGSLTGSKVGSGIDDDNVNFDDADGLWTATAIGPALEEMNDSINAGAPNGTGAKVHWSQLLGMPAGFADGSDDGSGGGSGDVVGPSGSTDNAIALYDDTTGKLLRDSSITSDGNSLTMTGQLTVSGAGDNELGGTTIAEDLVAESVASQTYAWSNYTGLVHYNAGQAELIENSAPITNSFLAYKGSGAKPQWAGPQTFFGAHRFFMEEHLMMQGVSGGAVGANWAQAALASGTFGHVNGEALHPGMVSVSASVNANSGGFFRQNAAAYLLSRTPWFTEATFRVSATNDTVLRFGWMSSTTAGEPTDGVYFNMSLTNGSGYGWISANIVSNSALSTASTSNQIVLNRYYTARAVIEPPATVLFSLYDWTTAGVVWTNAVTGQVPYGSRIQGHGFQLTSAAGGVAVLGVLDYINVGVLPELKPLP